MTNTARTVLPSHGSSRSRTVFVPHGGVPNVGAPVFTTDPYIVGITTVGETLTVYAGVVQPTPQVIEYQIFRGSDEVPGATSPFYTLTTADLGFTIKARVRAELDGKVTERFTPATVAVKPAAPPNFAPTITNPRITGTALVGNRLVCDIGQVTGFPVPTLTYRILAGGTPAATGTVTAGTSSVVFDITSAQLAKAITFEVTATNIEGSATATSAPTATVSNPSIPGTFEIQANLSGMEIGSRWDTFAFVISNSMMDDYYARGYRTIRLPTRNNRIQQTPFGPLDETYLTSKLKPAIDYAASIGLKFIIDDHAFGGRTFEVGAAPVSQLADTTFSGWTAWKGTIRADGLIENTETNTHNISKAVTVPAGDVTIKARVQAGTKPWLRLTWRKGTDYAVLGDLTNGVEIPNSASTWTTSVVAVGGGLYDLTVTAPDQTAGSGTVLFEGGNVSADYADFVATGRIYAGDGVSQPFKVISVDVTTASIVRKTYQYGSPELPNTAAADYWSKLATWLMANVNMAGVHGFDFMNEPNLWSADQCFDFMKQCIVAVRAVPGFDKWLYIEGIPWSGARTYWALNPNHHLLTQYDPLNKLIFSAHVYPDWNSSGGTPNVPSHGDEMFGIALEEGPAGAVVDDNTLYSRVLPFVQGCEARGVRGNIGEGGIINDSKLMTAGQKIILNLCQQHGVEWTHWAGGPGFGEAYYYSLNRRTSDGLQPFQQAVYDEYMGNPSPTIYGLSGPNQLASGATTATFTVRYHGLIKTGTTRVTFSDNGGGGSFVPAFVDLSSSYNNGYNAVATTVYTPGAAQFAKISCTNNKGWTNPASIDFSSENDFMSVLGIDPTAAVNILNPQRLVVRTYSGPLVRLRRADGVEQDFSAVGVGYNTGNVGRELDTAAITTWAAGQTYTEAVCYDQSGNGNNRRDATTENRVSPPAEQPAFVLGATPTSKPAIRMTTASKRAMTSPLDGSTGHTVIFAAKHTSGNRYVEWATNYTSYSIGPGVSQSFTPNTDPNGNQKTNERGGLALAMPPAEWHTYAVHWQSAKYDGMATYVDKVCQGRMTTYAASLNQDFKRTDATLGYFRNAASSGTLTADLGAMYVFRDTTATNTKTLTEAQIQGIQQIEMTYNGVETDPVTHDLLEAKVNTLTTSIDYNFAAGTYTENGVTKTLTDTGTSAAGSLTRNSTGLLVDASNTITWSAAVLAAMKNPEMTVQMVVGNMVFAASGKPYWFQGSDVSNADLSGAKNFTATPASNTNSIVGITCNSVSGGYTGGTTGNGASNYAIYAMVAQTGEAGAYITATGDYYKGGAKWNLSFLNFFKSRATSTSSFRVRRLRIFPKFLKRDYVDTLIYADGVMPSAGADLPNNYHGVNLAGPEFGSDPPTFVYYAPNGEIDFWYNSVGPAVLYRIPLKINRLMPTDNGAWNETLCTQLDRMIDRIKSLGPGAKVILDWHQYGHNPYGTGDLFSPAGWPTANAQQFMRRVVQRWGGSEQIWMGWNEPNGALTKLEWIAGLNAACAAWRDEGALGTFLYTGYGSVSAGRRLWLDVDSFATITDPGNNWGIELHCYFDGDTSGTHDVPVDSGGFWQYGDACIWARNNGARFFIGEWGLDDDNFGHNNAYLAGWRSFNKLRGFKDVFLGHTLWSGGGFGNGYLYKCSPRAGEGGTFSWNTPPYGDRWHSGMMRAVRDLSYDSEVIAPPPAPNYTVTFTPGTEINVSAIAADLTNVYELNASTDPTNQNRQVVTARYGPGTVTNTSVVFFTTDNWSTVVKSVLLGDSEATPWCDHLGNFYISTNVDGTLGGAKEFRVRKIPAGSSTLGVPVTVGNYVDRPHLHVDRSATSPFRGRIYCGGRQSIGGLRIWYSDNGTTWSTSFTAGDNDFNSGFLYGITTGADGTVYATYSGRFNIVTSNGVYAGGNQSHYCVKSTDGGATWTINFIYKNQETAATSNGVGFTTWSGNISVSPVTGRLHHFISQGATDIQRKQYLTSDDKGVTWTNNGALDLTLPTGWGPGHHFLECNASGNLCLGFYATNAAVTSNRYYVIGSKNDGATWNGLTKVNTTDSPSATGQRGVIGEDRNYGCVNADGSFTAVWESHLTGNNVYAARIRKMVLS